MPGLMIRHVRMSAELGCYMGISKCPAGERESQKFCPRGGITVIVDFDAAVGGVARCTTRDNYRKKVGVAIALARLNRGYRAEILNRDTLAFYAGIAIVIPRVRIAKLEMFLGLIEAAVEEMSRQHERQLGWAREHGHV